MLTFAALLIGALTILLVAQPRRLHQVRYYVAFGALLSVALWTNDEPPSTGVRYLLLIAAAAALLAVTHRVMARNDR